MGMSFGLPCWANFLGRMAVAVLVVGSSFFLAAPDSAAQDSVQEAAAKEDSGPTAQERAVAERFVQVLKRRPRPGTALDRVYGFHVQNGSLDDFIKTLQVADDAPDAGQNQMILGLLQSQRGKEAAAAHSQFKFQIRKKQTSEHEVPVCLFRSRFANSREKGKAGSAKV